MLSVLAPVIVASVTVNVPPEGIVTPLVNVLTPAALCVPVVLRTVVSTSIVPLPYVIPLPPSK